MSREPIPTEPRDEDDVLAGEYVLGVLSRSEREEAAARIRRSGSFAALVEAWEDRLAPLETQYAPVMPPAAAEERIMNRLFGGSAQPASAGLWNNVALWRGISFLTTGLAAATIALFLLVPRPETVSAPGERLAASLRMEGSEEPILAVYDGTAGRLSLTTMREKGPEEDYELWVIPAEGGDPVSLGVVPDPQDAEVTIDPDKHRLFSEGATLAISVEPKGGSPTGQATGPVIAAGPARGL